MSEKEFIYSLEDREIKEVKCKHTVCFMSQKKKNSFVDFISSDEFAEAWKAYEAKKESKHEHIQKEESSNQG